MEGGLNLGGLSIDVVPGKGVGGGKLDWVWVYRWVGWARGITG